MNKILSAIDSMPNKVFITIYTCTVFLFLVLIGLQGLDLTDESWLCYHFYNICHYPPTANSPLAIYNTILLGGLSHLLFSTEGMIAARMMSALCLTAVALLVYQMLKDVVNRWWIFIGVLMCIVYSHYLFVFHYNYATAFIAVAASLCIYKALTQRKRHFMFIAGIIVGIGVFFRLPNICLVALIAVLIPFYCQTQSLQLTKQLFLTALMGFVVGLILNISLICLFHHQEAFMESVKNTFLNFFNPSDSHSSNSLFTTYKDHIIDLITFVALCVAFPLADYTIRRQQTSRKIQIFVTCFIVMILLLKLNELDRYIMWLYALCFIVTVYTLFNKETPYNVKYLALLSIVSMSVIPFGSDGGLYNTNSNALYLALPLSIGLIFKTRKSSQKQEFWQSCRIYAVVFIAFFLFNSLYDTSLESYRDKGSRLKKCFRPTLTLQHTTFTSHKNAAQLDTLMTHLLPHIQNNNYILAYPNIPAINYLTQTHAYLDNPWVGIISYDNFCRTFEEAEQAKPLAPPVIVLQKSQDIRWNIPNRDWKTIDDCSDFHSLINAKNTYLQQFMVNNQYHAVWENELFAVYVTSQ